MSTCAWDRPPCWQAAALNSELCSYHAKLTNGLLKDSFGRGHDEPDDEADDER